MKHKQRAQRAPTWSRTKSRTASADLLTPWSLLGPLALVAASDVLVALVLWLGHMALWQLFQRPFDASSDLDIPKNVPFTLVINNLFP